jgi:hypothetical protein
LRHWMNPHAVTIRLLATVIFTAAGLLVSAVTTQAQDLPLQTPDAEIMAPGLVRSEVGFDFLQDVSFPLSGLSGDLTNLGVINMRTGLGSIVEIQVQGMIQEFLSIKSQGASFVALDLPSSTSTNDIGDFSLWTKILIFKESDHLPAFAFRFGYEMPNTNQARGIGNNATNVYGEWIAEKHFGNLAVFGDLGIGILTSPNAMYSQNDELMYGLAFHYGWNKRVSLVGEVNGRYTPRKLIPALYGTESRGQGRFGVELNAGGMQWGLAAIAGLDKYDPHAGFTFDVSKDFQLFDRNKVQQ